MRYRRLGRTDLQVSELSYGAARGASEDPQRFISTVRACIDRGINFIDTATNYDDGESERVLGQALEGYDEVLVETKYRPYDSYAGDANYTGSAEALTASAEESLRRLRRDRLDVLLGHGIRTLETLDRFMNDGCYEAMLKLREQGKVRFIGISELSEADGTHEVLKQALPTGAFDVVMLTVNILLQTATEEVIGLCRKHDVGTVVMMPLNQSSGHSGLTSLPAALELIARYIQAGQLPDEPPYNQPDILDFLQPYSVPAAAIRYVLAQDITTCCVGMRTQQRLEENLRAIDPPYLDEARLSRLRELFGRIRWQSF